jgi:ubiquinone/menaquinone biosynthesis C-methylase UbiE
LNAVLSPYGTPTRNRFLHAVNSYGARVAASLTPNKGALVDFGCGTGRFVRFFGQRGYSVIGTEITPEMLTEAERLGLSKGSKLLHTDGVHIPVPDGSVDNVWVCGVLRMSLFVADPVYDKIAEEMYRVLKPGGLVINLEMYVDTPPDVFTKDFENAGFVTADIRVLQRYVGRPERFFQWPRLPLWCVDIGGRLSAALRYRFDDPRRPYPGLRDYLFVWRKPTA